jgi:hypothetical protein
MDGIPKGYLFHYAGDEIPDGWKRRVDLEESWPAPSDLACFRTPRQR